ncbi:MAG: FAD-dependent monooxygenase [Bryobacterales bacterium]|nr:FAD-dependent monooxygenase [Bryobacterales bacterium]
MPDPDVFVIGGGPAGLAAAIAARRRGLSVVVADGNTPPIDKPCGEGLMPDSRRAAREIGIELPDAEGFEFRGIRFLGESHSVQADFPNGRGLGLRRPVLHGALIETAVRAGVELRWSTPIVDLNAVRARWIVGADGSTSRVRRWAGLDAHISGSRRYAFRQHFAIGPWTEFMEIHWSEGCQIYVTPISRAEVCVVLISKTPGLHLGEALERFFPVLNVRLRDAAASSKERGAVAGRSRLQAVAKRNVALIGDASGTVDPITGEGLCLTFRQAAVLAEAMVGGDLAAYNRTHPRLAFRSHLMARTMLLLDHNRSTRKFLLGSLAWQPWIFRTLLHVHVL